MFNRFFRRTQQTARVSQTTLVHWLDTTPTESNDLPSTVRSLEVQAHVCGIHAEVLQTIEIENPNTRPISASLTVPLPDRAVVCGYALEIGNQMVDGVVVPKERARVIFETEQRRGVDPGLVEAVRGNVYRTRVYPVPQRGTRRVRLRYVTPLLLASDGSAALDLPMPPDRLTRRAIRLDVEQLDAPRPLVSGISATQLLNRTGWSFQAEERDVVPTEAVRIALPNLPNSFVLLERDDEGDVWFCASEATTPTTHIAAQPITSLTVLWDASGSRAMQDHSAELALLKAYASSPHIRRLTLVVFANDVHEVREFFSAEELVKHVSNLQYDGGTDLEALRLCAEGLAREFRDATQSSACVLFTDGLDTLSDEVFSLPRELNAVAIVSGSERDLEATRQACRGLAFDASLAPRDAEQLAQTLAAGSAHRSLDVNGKGIADVCDVSSPTDDRRAAIGRLVADETTIFLGNSTHPLLLRAADARDGNVLACAWGARRVSILSPRAEQYADELLRLGKRFGMASPATSLLVLERLDQWLEYDIEPPTTLPDMRDAWRERKQRQLRFKPSQSDEDAHLATLRREWRELLGWWNRDYSVSMRQSNTSRLFCPNCGCINDGESLYCTSCGNRLQSANHPSVTRNYTAPGVCPYCGARLDPSLAFCENCYHIVETHDSPYLPQERRTGSSHTVMLDAAPTMTPPRWGADAVSESFSAPAPSSHSFEAARYAPSARESASFEAADSAFSGPTPLFASASASGAVAASRATTASSPAFILDEGVIFSPSPTVAVKPWSPNTSYLQELNRAYATDIWAARDAYFAQRVHYLTSPSFFVDCAGWFMQHDDKTFGIQVLTNLAELRIEDAALLRVLAWRLREAGELQRALVILRRVARLRPEDSQSHRDLALVLDELAHEYHRRGDEDAARAYAEEAAGLYRKTALTPWARRRTAIALFAVEEYNIFRAWAAEQLWVVPPELPSLDRELEGILSCDLRVTLAWDADETDVDIHVTEPSGEEAYYRHRNTTCGGRVSEDITDGYGPELYEVRKAPKGTYTIRAHYYASHQQTIFGPATCTLAVFTDWGRPNQQQRLTSVRLDNAHEMTHVGEVTIGMPAHTASPSHALAEEPDVHRITVGMSMDQVRSLMGEPTETGNDEWIWNFANAHSYAVRFHDGKVVKVLECMPWGDNMVIAQ